MERSYVAQPWTVLFLRHYFLQSPYLVDSTIVLIKPTCIQAFASLDDHYGAEAFISAIILVFYFMHNH